MSEAARFFQALGDETRLAILEELREGERTVGALVQALGCPQPKVSRHLKVLKDVGLVRDHKEGRNVRYGLARSARWVSGAREWVAVLDEGLVAEGLSRTRTAAPPRPSALPATDKEDLETYLL